jgi:hypothetical protein
MPEFSTEDEKLLLQLEQQKAEVEARATAKARGLGPKVTEKLVEKALIEARDAAHDRAHTRHLNEALRPPEEAELVPVQALLPAGVAAKMMQSEKEKNNRG